MTRIDKILQTQFADILIRPVAALHNPQCGLVEAAERAINHRRCHRGVHRPVRFAGQLAKERVRIRAGNPGSERESHRVADLGRAHST